MIQKTIEAFVQIKRKIAEQSKIINLMRKEEKMLVKEIQQYLNETGVSGIKVDADTVITLTTNEKKIPVSQKKYKHKLEALLKAKNIDHENLVDEIMDAKVQDVIREQKLKMDKKTKLRATST
jgi:hypothetical protein